MTSTVAFSPGPTPAPPTFSVPQMMNRPGVYKVAGEGYDEYRVINNSKVVLLVIADDPVQIFNESSWAKQKFVLTDETVTLTFQN